MILSILIPTVTGREESFAELEGFLKWQINISELSDKVEIKSICDNKEISIGQKRNKLLEMAQGEYCVMIDDDDSVHFQYLKKVLPALEKNPDCVGYKELCIYEGEKKAQSSCFSLRYKEWADNRDGFDHVRSPFYKMPIKTEICRSVGFKDMRYGEDHDFAKRILPHLKSEVFIGDFMYIYRHKHEEYNIKYGFTKA